METPGPETGSELKLGPMPVAVATLESLRHCARQVIEAMTLQPPEAMQSDSYPTVPQHKYHNSTF